MLLKGRVALVTGASRGIGAATAEVMTKRGARVCISARSIPDLERLATRIGGGRDEVLVVPCDVTDVKEIERMVNAVVAHWGRLDILVNNAGLGTPPMTIEDVTPEDWDRTVSLNMKSAYLCIRSVSPIMKKQAYGRIVNVSSIGGRDYSRLSGAQYTSAKAGLLGLTRHLAVELGTYGICVNAVAPGIVLSERIRGKWEARTPEDRGKILSNIPLRRLAEPEEIATVIAFLASDDASYVNGACVDINGGSYMS